MIEVLVLRETILSFQAVTGGNHLEVKSRSKPVDKEVWDRQNFACAASRAGNKGYLGGRPVSL